MEEHYGSDRIFWFDEHFTDYDEMSIPETIERAQWYGFTGWPYVRVDGSRFFDGIWSCEETALRIESLVDARLEETDGLSPIEITGGFRVDDLELEWDVTFRLVDPATLVNVRGTLMAIEDDVQSLNELFPRVTRAVHYESIELVSPGDSADFTITIPCDSNWDPDNMRAVVFLQRLGGSKEIIQGAVFPNGIASGVPAEPTEAAVTRWIESIHPNPFSGSTEVRIGPSASGLGELARLEIFDAQGRRVRTLLAGSLVPGDRVISWDGRSDAGESVRSGSYFIRLHSAAGVDVRKVIRIR